MNNEPDYDNLYFEEKKMHTPQVGDVWIHKNGDYPIHITDVGSNYIEFVGYTVDEYTKTKHRQYYTNSFSSLNNDERYTRFTEIHKYLGKSKAKIDDLFKTMSRNLDGIYFRIERNGKFENVCFSDMTEAELAKLKQQLAIAVKSLSTITNCAPACFRTEECPLEGGYGFNNGCFRCGYATAFEALQKIKELGK